MTVFRHPRQKLINLDEAATVAQQRGNLIVVFTNGVYDGYGGPHPGHLHCLLEARLTGDMLIVAVNSDASTRRLKGPTRPIMPWAERAFAIASLECVDYVIRMERDTPHAYLELLRPDILVKGGSSEYPVGHEVVTRNGGKIIVVPTLGDWSTTNIERKCAVADRESHPTQP